MLARTLLPNPPVLLMDEPTVGLDAPSAMEVRSLLTALSRDLGKTMLFTTHNLFEAERLCERVAIINGGRIIAVDTPLGLSRVSRELRAIELKVSGSLGEKGLSLLENISAKKGAVKVEEGEDYTLVKMEVDDEDEAMEEALRALHTAGYQVLSAQRVMPTLEEVFVKLTREGA